MVGQITITDRAAEKIRKLLTEAKDGYGLRVGVIEGGCSGYEYKMEIDSPGAEDKVFEQNGVRVLLGAKSIHHLDGTEMDYNDELMRSGFVFNNPNVKGTCGCGTFSAPKEAKATGPVYRVGVLEAIAQFDLISCQEWMRFYRITQIISARRTTASTFLSSEQVDLLGRLEDLGYNGSLVTTVKEVSPRVPFLGYLKFFT